MVAHGAPLEGVISKAVAVFEPAHNPGLLLGLLDGGAMPRNCARPARRSHPMLNSLCGTKAWKRVLLGELAAERASKNPQRRRPGM